MIKMKITKLMPGKRKGIGQVLTWVLLLGFAVALATVIFFWASKHTEKVSGTTISYVEGGMQCEQVAINFDETYGSACSEDVIVQNVGYLKVSKLSIRKVSEDPAYKDAFEASLMPQASYNISQDMNVTLELGGSLLEATLEVVPILEINGEFIGCNNKAAAKEC